MYLKKPNILLLMCDEHRADITGFSGNNVVKTPVLDRLAKSGVVFNNAYAASPVCVPGRQCMMSGKLPKTCGCEVYNSDLPAGYLTFPHLLSQYAYNTVACGKLHHRGQDQMQGWTQRIGSDTIVGSRFVNELRYEEVKKYPSKEDFKWSVADEIKKSGIGNGPHHFKDKYTVMGAVNFIKEYFCNSDYDRVKSHRPLMLKVSLVQPHYPYCTDRTKMDYYINRVNPFENQNTSEHPMLQKDKIEPGIHVNKREIKKAIAAYYGMVETADDYMGTILNTLVESGQDLNDWIIIYVSDHGDMLGEHNVWKKGKFYEGSVKVPMIIRWPGIFTNRIVKENVNLCDLYATICELTGIPIPQGIDSRSLVSLMNGENTKWNNETISQFKRNQVMIKVDNLKYQYYGEQYPEVLFDLKRDPSEVRNYINYPEYKERTKAFRQRLATLGHGSDADKHYINAGY